MKQSKATKLPRLSPVSCIADFTIEDDAWERLIPDVEREIREICEETLHTAGVGHYVRECEVSVLLTNNQTVKYLNYEYRGKDKPTNVLSFPTLDITPARLEEIKQQLSPVILGDIVLARETVEREAREQSKTFRDHVTHLVVHGTLHLLGYDHQIESEAEAMESLEVIILTRLGVKDPYNVAMIDD